ncbi:hypothetical protein IQA64_01900 [Leptospira borgpetersenii serovar Tarassovi]|nr:hypothetical protein [Leptospira borgpetersenii serovar Tarassovi]MBE8403594.1 hypothetical protein [Leptospira borgpetersenii serovar Tarassovi]MBE8406763.1 hypothetical protein [Leptospira borgpetersenii serovar Tarassovi]MBE8412958.1 hypothetical protein [Leptospira borgpetersenii serovar Tarassovi]MBE8416324.1 hypothetical protein [Leptospira borgpetersenii serovar Tarassovi]
MKSTVWRVLEPIRTIYAECWLRSPAKLIDKSACSKCGIGNKYEERPSPLIIEWENWGGENKVIGDFTWPSGGRFIVKETVFQKLNEIFENLNSGPVEMIRSSKIKNTDSYQGPPLVELMVDKQIPFLPETTTKVAYRCPTCDRVQRDLIRVELKYERWNKTLEKSIKVHKKRKPGKGLILSKFDIDLEVPFFRVTEFSDAIFRTDSIRILLLSLGLNHLDFLDYGEIKK